MDTSKQQATKARVWTPANIVTLVRILLIPIFAVALLSPWPEWLPYPEFWAAWQPWIAAIVFAGISATDAVDGHLARSRNEVTDLGKFMDPLADKILVCAAMLALVELQAFPSWVALIIIAREFIVSGLRMLAAADGQIIAASWYGKAKTFVTDIAIVFFLVMDSPAIAASSIHAGFVVLSWVLMVAAVVLTIISMIDYLVKSKSVIGLG